MTRFLTVDFTGVGSNRTEQKLNDVPVIVYKQEKRQFSRVRKQLGILQKIGFNSGVSQLLGYSLSADHVYIVTESTEDGAVSKFSRGVSHATSDIRTWLKVALNIAKVMISVHSRGVAHRNLTV